MNLTRVISKYFKERGSGIDCSVSIVREDGIVLYTNLQKKYRSQSIGALAAGVWQAATALNSTIDMTTSDVLDFRLSFDQSDEGVYLLGFNFNSNNYLVCALYSETVNPAKLKMNIRNIKTSLVSFLSTYNQKETHTNSDYLFNNITDEEMDRLFEYGGA